MQFFSIFQNIQLLCAFLELDFVFMPPFLFVKFSLAILNPSIFSVNFLPERINPRKIINCVKKWDSCISLCHKNCQFKVSRYELQHWLKRAFDDFWLILIFIFLLILTFMIFSWVVSCFLRDNFVDLPTNIHGICSFVTYDIVILMT